MTAPLSKPTDAQERLKGIKKSLGDKDMGKVTVNMVIGGMRGITVSAARERLSNVPYLSRFKTQLTVSITITSKPAVFSSLKVPY